jgi:hypothetical protein
MTSRVLHQHGTLISLLMSVCVCVCESVCECEYNGKGDQRRITTTTVCGTDDISLLGPVSCGKNDLHLSSCGSSNSCGY